MTLRLLFFLLIFCCGCAEKPDPAAPDLAAEIAALDTPRKLSDYYEAIYDADQNTRNAATAALQTHGNDSPEHRVAEQKVFETDQLNRKKIRLLYERYGHPTVDGVGDKAASAPWLVIHHIGDPGERLANWSIIKAGHEVGAIDDNGLSMYLNRTYAGLNNGERLRMQGRFKPRDQIDSLLQLLELEL